MTKKLPLLFLVLIALLNGCQFQSKAEVSEEQAKRIVQQYNEMGDNDSNFGAITITSIKHINNEYEVKWERKSNCENGIDYVNDQDGTINHSVVSIC